MSNFEKLTLVDPQTTFKFNDEKFNIGIVLSGCVEEDDPNDQLDVLVHAKFTSKDRVVKETFVINRVIEESKEVFALRISSALKALLSNSIFFSLPKHAQEVLDNKIDVFTDAFVKEEVKYLKQEVEEVLEETADEDNNTLYDGVLKLSELTEDFTSHLEITMLPERHLLVKIQLSDGQKLNNYLITVERAVAINDFNESLLVMMFVKAINGFKRTITVNKDTRQLIYQACKVVKEKLGEVNVVGSKESLILDYQNEQIWVRVLKDDVTNKLRFEVQHQFCKTAKDVVTDINIPTDDYLRTTTDLGLLLNRMIDKVIIQAINTDKIDYACAFSSVEQSREFKRQFYTELNKLI